MPPKSNVPIRICGSKVRTGCRTCKARHLKCDERHPICLRCQKGNRQCIYEQPLLQASQEVSSPGSETGSAVSVGVHNRAYFDFAKPHVNLSPYGACEVADVTAIKNFVAQLGKQFAGCFSDQVWCDLLPRMAQYEPCVWHGIVAVSTLNSSMRSSDDYRYGNSSLNLATKRYGKALRELNTRLSSDQSIFCKDVILVSCILFAVFECLQGHYQSALCHISCGMKLLMEWAREAEFDENGGAGGYLDYASLEPVFLALDTQAVQMGEVTFRDYLALPGINGQLQAPISFASAEDAHHLLNQIFNRMSRWSQWVEPCEMPGKKPDDMWMVTEEKSIRSQLYEWDFAFDTSLSLMDPTPAIMLLLTQRRCIQACFNKSTDGPSELMWDNGLPLFKEAVQYAEAYMELSNDGPLPYGPNSEGSYRSKSEPTLTIAMDIVMPLFLISAKCRHPETRRRGLKLLKTCDRREGIWDSRLCAQIAEKIIELEEAGALADGHIPDSARVYGLDVRLGDDKEGEITHKKRVVTEDGHKHTETHEEIMAW